MRKKLLSLLLFCTLTAGAQAAPRVRDLPIPGDPRFAAVARDVLDVVVSIDPSEASGAGLMEDARRVPSYTPAAVQALHQRLQADMTAMRAMPWRTWPVASQVDLRWVFANAESADRALEVEQLYRHRPGQWLEPTANNLIALMTYAPQRRDLQQDVLQRIPAMLDEVRKVCTEPTRRDVHTAVGLVDGLLKMCRPGVDDTVVAALRRYRADLLALHPTREFAVVGADDYAWRLQHVLLLPWTPQELLAMARQSEKSLTAQLAAMKHTLPPDPPPTPRQVREARALTRDRLLALYDAIPRADRAWLLKSGVVTVPPQVGPIHARETPDAMVPLTGDGGSMNPPPVFSDTNVGYWNVEHFHKHWTLKERLDEVTGAEDFRQNGMGPYAAHEGVPGHHLQLSIARLNPDPLRNVLSDSVENEGWALYAEEMFWQSGGLGHSPQARYDVLSSFLYRARRVVYDVNVETGRWTLQQAADYKHRKPAGQGRVDEDIMRSINWPTQLISYYAGKMQILQLKADYRKKMGAAYSDRAFHDALLKVGSIPFVFARAELLGEPVPDLPPDDDQKSPGTVQP